MSRWIRVVLLYMVTMSTIVSAFTTAPMPTATKTGSFNTGSAKIRPKYSSFQLNAVNKKTKLTKAELAELEVRDMTRDEMLALNAENEKVMNQELTYMTVFSLIISAPLLYLAWVGFFAETAEIAMQ